MEKYLFPRALFVYFTILTIQYSQARVCEDGKWGRLCRQHCATTCISGKCNNTDGSCSCTAGWTGKHCSEKCGKGSFGIQCKQSCSDGCRLACDHIDGSCKGVCIIGRSGTFCEKSCVDGRWGDNCKMRCSKTCINKTCDSVNGTCLCVPGRTGFNCRQHCETGTYGANCALSCSPGCRENSCDNVNGTCIKGCRTGQTGLRCDQECNTGTYGKNCSLTCSPGCKGSNCDSVSGICIDGCKAGKTGPYCDKECDTDTYGVNCAFSCSRDCNGNTCDNVNGTCINGCTTGKTGPRCDQECNTGVYGTNCVMTCSPDCKGSECDSVSGICIDGCKAGKTGPFCDKECDTGTYGANCALRCSRNCKGNSCDNVNGTCINGCRSGKTGLRCDEDCAKRTWGENCKQRCAEKCVDSGCNKTDGSCQCIEGWMGHLCSERCKFGTFGRDCDQKCSNSCKNSECNVADGTCSDGCIPGRSGGKCEDDGSNVIEFSLIALLVAIVIAVAVATLYLVYKRKRRRFPLDKVGLISKSSTAGSSVASTASFYAETKNPVFQTHLEADLVEAVVDTKVSDSCTTVAVDAFLACLEKKKQQPQLSAYREEYNILPNDLQAPALAAKMRTNVMKNRYRNIVPYDHCRVRLEVQNGEKTSDYINASYIDGFDKKRAYIASQGPTRDITDDFWRMVWQLNCCKIVMLTNLMEAGRRKCEQYWPESGFTLYGEVAVKMISCETFSQFTIRTFHIRKNRTKNWRVVKQFHFTSWPDCKAPRCAQVMVSFRDKVIESKCTGKGPMVVHCSAGVGRTGTFIALDYLLRQAQATGFVDVYNCVKRLRTYRPNMVQTLAQYVYLHDVLAEGLNLSSVKIIPVFKYQQVYRDLLDIDPVQKKRNIQLIFEFLQANTVYPPDTEFAAGKVNKDKNRYHNILPVDTYMPVLEFEYEGRNDYINAVYFRTYNLTRGFILTQMPMEDTIIDFWRLVREQRITCIVMVNEIDESELYWPIGEKQEASYGLFRIRRVADEILDDYVIVTLGYRYKDNDEQVLKLFRSRFWPEEQAIPESPKRMLHLVLQALKCQRETGSHPMLVHCLDGVERSGLFCVVTAVIDRLKTDQNISIPCFIRDMRSRRPQIIPNLAQFQFCYDAVSCYLKQFVDFPFYDSDQDMPL